MKTKGKIYIVGAKRDADCIQKFNDAQIILEKQRFQVINPMSENTIDELMDALETCTAIYVMPCAVNDTLSKTVIDYALAHNYDVYYELENVEANEPADHIHD